MKKYIDDGLDSVKQLQTLNLTMKEQFNDYDVNTVMVMGIAGGNGLEHVKKIKYTLPNEKSLVRLDYIERMRGNQC